MRKGKKVPYRLLIHTNAYTGNFERELVAYSIGILDERQEGYAPDFIKAFWTSVAGEGITCLEDYENEELNIILDNASDILAILNNVDELLKGENFKEEYEKKKEEMARQRYEEDIRRLYDTYLCYTYQEVDDWEQDTFYNIKSFYKNKEYNCDTVFIQLNKPLPEKIEKIVTQRIKNFFESDAYNIIKNYEWLCSFGEGRKTRDDYKLLDLELVDSEGNLVKKYV